MVTVDDRYEDEIERQGELRLAVNSMTLNAVEPSSPYSHRRDSSFFFKSVYSKEQVDVQIDLY